MQDTQTRRCHHHLPFNANAVVKGRWPRRHDRRLIPLPSRYTQDTSSICARFQQLRRLPRSLRRRWKRSRRERSRSCLILRKLRVEQKHVAGQKDRPEQWQRRNRTYGSGQHWRGCGMRCASTDRGREATGSSGRRTLLIGGIPGHTRQ